MDRVFREFVRFGDGSDALRAVVLRFHDRKYPGMVSVYQGVRKNGGSVPQGGVADNVAENVDRSGE